MSGILLAGLLLAACSPASPATTPTAVPPTPTSTPLPTLTATPRLTNTPTITLTPTPQLPEYNQKAATKPGEFSPVTPEQEAAIFAYIAAHPTLTDTSYKPAALNRPTLHMGGVTWVELSCLRGITCTTRASLQVNGKNEYIWEFLLDGGISLFARSRSPSLGNIPATEAEVYPQLTGADTPPSATGTTNYLLGIVTNLVDDGKMNRDSIALVNATDPTTRQLMEQGQLPADKLSGVTFYLQEVDGGGANLSDWKNK